jgi:hypothetical protein
MRESFKIEKHNEEERWPKGRNDHGELEKIGYPAFYHPSYIWYGLLPQPFRTGQTMAIMTKPFTEAGNHPENQG